MDTTRRWFVGAGLGGTALLAVGGLGLGLSPSVLREPTAPLQALGMRSFATLAAIADCICPGGDGVPSASEVGVAEKVDALVATAPSHIAEDLEVALSLIENALVGLLLEGRWTTFTACPRDVQVATLASWEQSSIAVRRQAFKGIRGLVAAAYHASPETYDAVGYPGPPDYSRFVVPAAAPQPDPMETP